MSLMSVQEIEKLRKEIEEHNNAYYREDAPKISDAEYDALLKKLKNLEAEAPDLFSQTSPTQTVGSEPSEGFQKITHGKAMLSLDNAFDVGDVNDFVKRIRKFLNYDPLKPLEISAEPKIDGLSCSITYEKGQLVKAATRGNGQIGEDVTENIKTVQNIRIN